ncbi:hypothetical protein IR083_10080 [Dysgonomonas sp. GY75]|uniref:hypothetical protein n=1 Tax=Dysgonomonas sp. GY75 TaxID=2780419 RepID=UPI0018839293|nr:hypothetical protein [Dysgonomonas sp. GY75]MBF0649168.1 hypothetical protein [Dysgonomonas sp. GY75]
MLLITTDNNTVKLERNGQVLCVSAKSTISYSFDNVRVFLNPPDIVRISAAFSDGIEIDGTPITPDNIETEFKELFFLGSGGGGTDDHTQLSNRNVADQHPISAITNLGDMLDTIQEDINGLATMQGNWLGQNFAAYADLAAYDAGLAVKPADKTWTRVFDDENHDNNLTVYAWFSGALAYQYTMVIDPRNFYTDPIQTGEITDDAVTDTKIGYRTLDDNNADATLVTYKAKFLIDWLQGIRDNLKYLFSLFTNGKANSAAQADELATARTISLSGDATGSVSFDGSADADIPVILNSLGIVKNGVVRISGNGGDYASTVGPYQARRYFKLADIQYQTQGWDSKLLFDIFYTQASNGAGSGEVSDKVVLQLEFADNTFNIIQRTNGVNGNGIVIIHDSARQIFEVYGCASPGVVDSNRLYIDVRNMFFYIVNNDDNNAPAINFFANQGSYSNNTGLTQQEFNALSKTSMKWLWDSAFTELNPSQVQVGDNVSAFDFLTEPDPTVIITSVYTMFSLNSNALRLAEVSQDWLEGNGNLAAGALGIFDYSGTFTPIWTYNNGWEPSFEFEYLNDGSSHTVRWNTDIKRIGLTVPEPVTSNNTGDGYDDGLFIVEMA